MRSSVPRRDAEVTVVELISGIDIGGEIGRQIEHSRDPRHESWQGHAAQAQSERVIYGIRWDGRTTYEQHY